MNNNELNKQKNQTFVSLLSNKKTLITKVVDK